MSRASEVRAQRQRKARRDRLARIAFGVIVVGVLGTGTILAFGDFLDRPAASDAPGSITIQSSMAGFTPSVIRATAGTTVTLDWWTQDSVLHLERGVHTMIAPELGLYEELPGEASRAIVWEVPDRPGTYDVYCDTCCGGKESPSMHGRIVIEPAA